VRPAHGPLLLSAARRRAAWLGRREQGDDKGCDRSDDETDPAPKLNRTAAALCNPTGKGDTCPEQKQKDKIANHVILHASGLAKINLRELGVN
jgi:hypothetical protein